MNHAFTQVERWGIFDLTMEGPANGNPFLDVQLSARFRYQHRVVEVDGFYDGKGRYKIRFMPDTLGEWHYVTQSNAADLDGVTGQLTCTAPAPGNHGPVGVRNTYHFAYADGTPYCQVGTTCYAWAHQGDDLEKTTLDTLARSPFNKIRMCVFPKDYAYSKNEPEYYPFERNAAGRWDFGRFNAEFFRHFEKRVGQLRDLGVQADVILFHPYDRWGFATMEAESDESYLRYIVARLAAYRNVWWSLANEYDLMKAKRLADWDRFFRIVQESDPYQHLRSIHNCRQFYDHSKPWVTHCSVQHSDLSRTREWREAYRKPVVVDECCYEGNLEQNWGNISARELVHRFWLGTVGGGYVGHGETYSHPEDILWWSKGGNLHGESPARIAFLREILEQGPPEGLDPLLDTWEGKAAGREGEFYLFYFGVHQPAEYTFRVPEGAEYEVDVIDTWGMTSTRLEGTFEGVFKIQLPGKPHIAVRISKAGRQRGPLSDT
jgi:hypothetical protein